METENKTDPTPSQREKEWTAYWQKIAAAAVKEQQQKTRVPQPRDAGKTHNNGKD